MKTKYIINKGLAFSEKNDLKKFEDLANEGWILKDFAFGGFFFKLEQGEQQSLSYTLDLQADPDPEYKAIFEQAGWKHVSSFGNRIHIFCAPKGTSPIYSDDEIAEGKYTDFTASLGKTAVYAFLAFIIFSMVAIWIRPLSDIAYYPVYIAVMLSLIAFVFSFMPYLKYKFNERKQG
jgi:hypothetical protein